MACVQRNKVQRRNSKRTWLPTIDFPISVRSRWIRAANLLIPILCNGWVSERRDLVAVDHTTHTSKPKAGRWEKQFSWTSVSSLPCIWLCSCLTTENHCALKEVTVIIKRSPMLAATTTLCYSAEDQDSTYQSTGLPVGDCLHQAGHGCNKAPASLTSVGLPSCNGKSSQSPCECPTPSIPVQVTFGYWWFPISLLLIPKDLAGYVRSAYVFQFFALTLPQLQGHWWTSGLQRWVVLPWVAAWRRSDWDEGKRKLLSSYDFCKVWTKESHFLCSD